MAIAYGVGLLLLLIVTGIPVGFALGLAGALSLFMIAESQVVMGLLGQVVHHTAANYVLLTIPMFILMAEFLGASGVAQDLMVASNRLLRRVRGGLAMACVMAGAILGAASGSSTASVSSMASAAYPTMKSLGYDRGFSIGTISISGTLAILIPPSIALIVYGILTEESIGRLFMAGLAPGVLTALAYIVTIYICVRLWPHLVPSLKDMEENASDISEKVKQKGKVWPIVLLISLVLGGLYSGLATPTEIGALGALGALVICIVLGRLNTQAFTIAVGNTLRTTTMIVTIIFGALLFGYFLSYTQVTNAMLSWIADVGLSPYAVLLMVVGLYLILGMFMDQHAIIVLTVPITYALLTGLGFDGIWLGIVIVKTAEIGLVTPPLGLNVFIASATVGVPTKEGFSGVWPFVVCELVLLGLILAFPEIVLFVPNMIG